MRSGAGNWCDPEGAFFSGIFASRFGENAQAWNGRGSFDVFKKNLCRLHGFTRAKTLLHADQVTGFWSIGNGRTNRILITIDHAGNDSGLIQKGD